LSHKALECLDTCSGPDETSSGCQEAEGQGGGEKTSRPLTHPRRYRERVRRQNIQHLHRLAVKLMDVVAINSMG
ncbi:hypothetical protein RRG08_066332, partial [Elysia crispata]